jgi:hypothetical protein
MSTSVGLYLVVLFAQSFVSTLSFELQFFLSSYNSYMCILTCQGLLVIRYFWITFHVRVPNFHHFLKKIFEL